jgi:hypothetical protein
MESRIKKKIDTYFTDFKKDINLKIEKLNIPETLNGEIQDLLEYLYNYDRLVLTNDDFSKRKRLKNNVPNVDRCTALKSFGEQCTRKRRDGSDYCGTHLKGTPNGVVDVCQQTTTNNKILLTLNCDRGIYNYSDKNGKIYSMEDVLNNEKKIEENKI